MDFSFLSDYYKFFLIGARNTIFISIFSVLFGTILGLILALMKTSKNKVLKVISTAYVEFVRGTPLLIQLYIIYYGLPLNLPEIPSGILALTLNSSAYVAEIVRSGIQSIDIGQMEAARSMGMSEGMAMRYVIIPQALKNIIPALGNEFITVIKESAIVSVIGVPELMYNSETVTGNIFKPFEPLIVAALLYFALTFTLSKGLSKIEGRLRVVDKSA